MNNSIISTSECDSSYSKETINTTIDLDTTFEGDNLFSLQKAVRILSDLYTTICINNSHHRKEKYIKKDIFYSKIAPKISIEDYLQQIVKQTQIEVSTLIISMIYLNIITEKIQNLFLCFKNIHRFILTSIVLSAKFNEDIHFTNFHYANIGGITSNEMLDLEFLFLDYIEFKLFVNESEYEKNEKMFRNYLSEYKEDE